MSKHKTHSVDRTPSREAIRLDRVLKALQASKASLSSFKDKVVKVVLVTFLRNLRECLEVKLGQGVREGNQPVAKDKT